MCCLDGCRSGGGGGGGVPVSGGGGVNNDGGEQDAAKRESCEDLCERKTSGLCAFDGDWLLVEQDVADGV